MSRLTIEVPHHIFEAFPHFTDQICDRDLAIIKLDEAGRRGVVTHGFEPASVDAAELLFDEEKRDAGGAGATSTDGGSEVFGFVTRRRRAMGGEYGLTTIIPLPTLFR